MTTVRVSIVLLLVLLTGCGGMRFVIDTVPVDNDLVETTVIADATRGFQRGGKVALVDVSGFIADADQGAGLGLRHNPVARFDEALTRAQDRDVDAVIIRVNSPGGTVTASAIMYGRLMRFRERTKKPVVVLMGDVAASGGYYLACGADEIIAHPTTITGSIGVIMQTVDVSAGMQRIGIKADVITSGPNKALGSPFQPMSAEHRAILQGIVDEFYTEFLDVVRTERSGIPAEDLAMVTDGRVVTGARAVTLGLVDGVGDLYDAFEIAKDRAGLTRARLVRYHDPLREINSPYAQAPLATQVNLLQLNLDAGLAETPGFFYLWDPTVWAP